MAQFHPAWLEHQRKRWRRHDWHGYVRPDSEGAGVHRIFQPQSADVEQDSIARKDSAGEAEAASEELEA
jgi:hypothetical protein